MNATIPSLVGNQVRSRERYQRATVAAMTAALSKVAVVAAQLAIMPLMLSHLGIEQYGIWFTLQSLLGLTPTVDLGIPNAAQNAMTTAAAQHDRRRLGSIASTAILMLCGIALAVVIAAFITWAVLPREWLPRATRALVVQEVAIGGAVFALAFAASLPLGFVESFSAAFQQASVGNLARAAAALGTLAAAWLALAAGASFGVVCLATVGPVLVAWMAAWAVAWSMHPDLPMGPGLVTADAGRSLVRSGLPFYGIQLCAALGFGVDNLLIASLSGPEAVARYAVPQRIFSIVLVAATVCLAPLWPAYADARARGDEPWIAKTLQRSLAATVVLALLGTATVALAMPWLMETWLGGAVATTSLMASGLAALTACQCLGAAVAFYWNGVGQLRLQFVLGVMFLLIAMPLKCLAIGRLGLDWLPAVSAVAYAVVILLPAWALSVRHATAHGIG